MKVASFFVGCGGLDLGFRQAGFDVVWAYEPEKYYRPSYSLNHPDTYLAARDLALLTPDDIPSCDGFIGAPYYLPWQPLAHNIDINYFEAYFGLLKRKQPRFFAFECDTPSEEQFPFFKQALSSFERIGYNVVYRGLLATDFRVPQRRAKVFVIGFSKALEVQFSFPKSICNEPVTLEQALKGITAVPRFYDYLQIPKRNEVLINHDVLEGKLAINERLKYDAPATQLPDTAWDCPVIPAKTIDEKLPQTALLAAEPQIQTHRRLSVRECARIQTFPDDYELEYESIEDGYRMVFQATPPRVAATVATQIKAALLNSRRVSQVPLLVGYYKDETHLLNILNRRLYYVRSGYRRGALQMPAGMPLPQYILLHNAGTKHLYPLEAIPPFYVSGPSLCRLGFAPTDRHYTGFRLADTQEVNIPGFDITHFRNQTTGRDGAIPYVIMLNL